MSGNRVRAGAPGMDKTHKSLPCEADDLMRGYTINRHYCPITNTVSTAYGNTFGVLPAEIIPVLGTLMGYTRRRASIGTVIYNLKSNLSLHGTVHNTTNTLKPIG